MTGRRTVGVLALASAFAVGPAASASAEVVINEVNSCEGGDWVELVNTGEGAVDVSGWLLTDQPIDQEPPDLGHRMLFAEGSEIAASGTLVLDQGDGENEFPFGIGCSGDHVRLSDETGSVLVDESVTPDLDLDGAPSWGRYPNGTGAFTQTQPTPGEPNLPFGGGEPGEDLAGWLYDPEAVVEIDLELSPEAIAELEEEPDEYVDAQFSLQTTGGTYGPLQIGARLKGQGSFRPLSAKAAFKLKFHHSVGGQRFLGLKGLTLNNMVQDPSMIREALAFEAFRESGVAAPRTGYAWVRVNGQAYGIYANVETLDDVALGHWFEDTQHLFEAGFYGIDVRTGEVNTFEIDEGSEVDLTDLEGLIAAVNAPGDFSDNVEGVADLDRMLTMWALEHYLGHWDGYAPFWFSTRPNNYYLHSDSSSRFSMIPWGTDQTLRARLAFDVPGGGLMFTRCLGDESCAALYREAVIDARATLAGLDLPQRAASIASLLGPWQQIDPRREYDLGQIAAGVAEVQAFLAARPGDVQAWLDGPPAADPPLVERPETTITARPRARSRAKLVSFRFSSDGPAGTGFECKLDRNRYRPCGSPLRWRPGAGRHRLRVRAKLAGGLVDATAAEARFVLLGPRR